MMQGLRIAVLGTALSGAAWFGAPAAAAPVLTTLVSFDGANGSLPGGALVFDLAGDLYGTTPFGGTGGGEFGNGTVFELSGTDHRTFTTLVNFGGNGTGPQSALTIDIFGNLYGTTGNLYETTGPGASGTVFELPAARSRTPITLASFAGGNGAKPFSGLALYEAGQPKFPGLPYFAGNLFGTTDAGGADGDGTVFELSGFQLSGADHKTLTTLVSFTGADGEQPDTTLVADGAGNLYGTTTGGGPGGSGTVFEVSGANHRTLTTLVAFDGTNGSGPRGGLALDAAGNLYGTTEGGGPGFGGTIFELSGPGHRRFATLASFGLFDPNGAAPEGGLLIDAAGNLYGTTTGGGVDFAPANLGSVFKLAADHRTLTRLYRFNGQDDGAIPTAGLTADLAGNLYGTASSGGTAGDGTVFELSGTGFVTIFDLISSRQGR